MNLNFTAGRESMESALQQCGIKTILTSRAFVQKAKLEPLSAMVFLEDVRREITSMLGYLGDEERTQQVLRDGWYVTGDIAAIDEDGFIRIMDRLSRFSKIGGEMVPHLKVEDTI